MPQPNHNDSTPHWTIPAIAVTVDQLAPSEFIWKLVERHSGHPAKCVAQAVEIFGDYEQALAYGFEALGAGGACVVEP